MTNDNLGFMAFPEITPGIPRSEDAPTDTIHIPAGATNVDDAKLFPAYVASAGRADQAERGDRPVADEQELDRCGG